MHPSIHGIVSLGSGKIAQQHILNQRLLELHQSGHDYVAVVVPLPGSGHALYSVQSRGVGTTQISCWDRHLLTDCLYHILNILANKSNLVYKINTG